MSAMDNMIDKAFSDWRKEYPYAHPVQDRIAFDSGFHAGMRATRPAPTEAEVEAAVRRMAEICSPPKGASFEDACEWVPPTIEDLARAALGVSDA